MHVIDDVISIKFFNTVCPDMRFAVANGVRSSPNFSVFVASFMQAKLKPVVELKGFEAEVAKSRNPGQNC